MAAKDDVLSLVSNQRDEKKDKKKKGDKILQIGRGMLADQMEDQSKKLLQKAGMALTGHVTNSPEDIDKGIRAHQSNAILNAQVATGTKGLSEINALKGANKVVGDVNEGVKGFLSSANDAIRGNKKDNGEKDQQETQENAEKAVENEPAAETPAPEEASASNATEEKTAKEGSTEETTEEKAEEETQEAEEQKQTEEATEEQTPQKEQEEKKEDKGTQSLPSIGKPKGKGTGKNAAERLANSGAAYKVSHYDEVGTDLSGDIQKNVEKTNAATPGKEGMPIVNPSEVATVNKEIAKNKSKTAKIKAKDTAGKPTPKKENKSKARAEAQKAALNQSSSESIPQTPNFVADTSGVNQCSAEESQAFTSSMSESERIAQSVDPQIQGYDFSKINTPKVTVDAPEQIETDELVCKEDMESVGEEGQALFNSSPEAQAIDAQAQDKALQYSAAESQYNEESAQCIANYEQKVEETKAVASAEQDKMICEETAALDQQVSNKLQSTQKNIEALNAEAQIDQQNTLKQIQETQDKANRDANAATQKAKEQQKRAEAEGEKKKEEPQEKPGILGRMWNATANLAKKVVNVAVDFVKGAVNLIVKALKATLCAILDAAAAAVSLISDEYGNRMKARTQKWKNAIREFADAVVNFTNQTLDKVSKLISKALDEVAKKITEFEKTLVERLSAIGKIFTDIAQAFKDGHWLLGALNILMIPFTIILRTAAAILGIDVSFLDVGYEAIKAIIQNPGLFFKTFGLGIIEGFKQFGRNIVENLKVMLVNLLNIWLAGTGVKFPKEFNLPNFIKFGLELIGINIGSFLEKFGLEDIYKEFGTSWGFKAKEDASEKQAEAKAPESNKSTSDTEVSSNGKDIDTPEVKDDEKTEDDDKNSIEKLVDELKTKGIAALIPYIKENAGDLIQDIIAFVAKSFIEEAITKGLIKLAMMANPIGGIVAVIKAAWDIIQFIRKNGNAIAGLLNTVTNIVATAAMGEMSGVANAVEATLCQTIPLVIELLLRLAGIDIGSKVTAFVQKIRDSLSKLLGKVAEWIKGLAKAAKTKIKQGARAIKNSKPVETVLETKDKAVGVVADSRPAKAVAGAYDSAATSIGKTVNGAKKYVGEKANGAKEYMNNSKPGQYLTRKGYEWQQNATKLNAWTKSAKSTMDEIPFDLEGSSNMLSGDKYGTAGIKVNDLNKLQAWQEFKKDPQNAGIDYNDFGEKYDDYIKDQNINASWKQIYSFNPSSTQEKTVNVDGREEKRMVEVANIGINRTGGILDSYKAAKAELPVEENAGILSNVKRGGSIIRNGTNKLREDVKLNEDYRTAQTAHEVSKLFNPSINPAQEDEILQKQAAYDAKVNSIKTRGFSKEDDQAIDSQCAEVNKIREDHPEGLRYADRKKIERIENRSYALIQDHYDETDDLIANLEVPERTNTQKANDARQAEIDSYSKIYNAEAKTEKGEVRNSAVAEVLNKMQGDILNYTGADYNNEGQANRKYLKDTEAERATLGLLSEDDAKKRYIAEGFADDASDWLENGAASEEKTKNIPSAVVKKMKESLSYKIHEVNGTFELKDTRSGKVIFSHKDKNKVEEHLDSIVKVLKSAGNYSLLEDAGGAATMYFVMNQKSFNVVYRGLNQDYASSKLKAHAYNAKF